MELITGICLAVVCVLSPVSILLWAATAYALGMGMITIPGITRQEKREGADWVTVPDFTYRGTDTLASTISVIGSLFGLVGFLLPWVSVRGSSVTSGLILGGLQGTVSGLALALQSLLVGFNLLTANTEGGPALGVILIVISLLTWIIPIFLVLVALASLGMISVPLGLTRARVQRLATLLVALSGIGLCLMCSFYIGVQTTVGGLRVGGGTPGNSLASGVDVANGFWITMGGLVLALFGAVLARNVSTTILEWSWRLANLERAKSKPGQFAGSEHDQSQP